MSRLEACRWLKSNQSEHAFAGNRFNSNEAALRFIENLYQKGALSVIIDNIFRERWRIKEYGGPYADTLIVVMPEDHIQKEQLIQISQAEYNQSPAGFERIIDDEHNIIIFWWD